MCAAPTRVGVLAISAGKIGAAPMPRNAAAAGNADRTVGKAEAREAEEREHRQREALARRAHYALEDERVVVYCTRSFENTRSSVQSSATRSFFSKRGSLER